MTVNRLSLLAAGLSCLALTATAFAQNPIPAPPLPPNLTSDWTKVSISPTLMGKRADAIPKAFRNVTANITLDYQIPVPKGVDPQGYGGGRFTLEEFFWSPTKYRVTYPVYASKPWHSVPITTEALAADGFGKILRIGEFVGSPRAQFSPKQKLFDFPTDAQLVENWPRMVGKLVFTNTVGGTATFTRYLSALERGVGGYSLRTEARGGRQPAQYRIVATRSAKGARPASTVEIIFDATLGLPLTINATMGDEKQPKTYYQMYWSAHWKSKQKMPKSPFDPNYRDGH